MKVEVDGKTYVVKEPGRKEVAAAKLVSNKVFKQSLSSDEFFLRDELYTILRKRGFWNDEKEKELLSIKQKIVDKELVLKRGGIELDEAKEIALSLRVLRYQLLILTAKEREFDHLTVESQADNAYFDALVAECVFDEEGNKIFSSLDDYNQKRNEEYAYVCAEKLAEMVFDISDFEKNLPENKFLTEYGFVDENLKLIESESESDSKEEEEVKFSPFLKNGEPVK